MKSRQSKTGKKHVGKKKKKQSVMTKDFIFYLREEGRCQGWGGEMVDLQQILNGI